MTFKKNANIRFDFERLRKSEIITHCVPIQLNQTIWSSIEEFQFQNRSLNSQIEIVLRFPQYFHQHYKIDLD